MFKSDVFLTGRVVAELIGPDGRVRERREIDNLVVTAGKEFLAQRMLDNGQAAMSHMAVGTGAVAPAAGDTALGAELVRVALTNKSVDGRVMTHVASLPAGTGTGALTEAGLFNAPAAGTMQARVTFPVMNKQADDSFSLTWAITVN